MNLFTYNSLDINCSFIDTVNNYNSIIKMADGDNTDKGWSWVVMISSFAIHVIYGFFNGMGVLQVALLEEYGEAVWKTSWATGLFLGVLQLLGPIAGLIINVWSCRTALILGSLLTTAGLVISAFVKNINYVIISIGIIAGFGACLSITASEVVIGFNFVRHRNLACGIALSGTGVGTLIFIPLMQMAKDYYGYTGLCLMCGALTLQQVIFGALCRPSILEIKSKDHTKNGPARKALSDLFQSFRLLKRLYFAFLCMSLTASSFGIFMMYVHFTSLVLQQGATKTEAANFLSVSGACYAVSRFLVGIASNSDNINELLLYSGCFSIIGLATLAIPLYINYYGGQIAFSVILGTYCGCCYTLLNSITVKLVGIENLAMAYGTEFLAGGIGAISGPVVLGFLVDAGFTYAEAFMVAGFSVLVGGIFGGSVSCFDNGRASKVDGDGRSQQQDLVNRNEGITDKQAPLKMIEDEHIATHNDTSTYI